jgi:hypothetical protein
VSPAATAVDPILTAAVDLAREQAEQEAPGLVGEHLGVAADDERVATHFFATLDPAYRGWRWAVTLARASRGRTPTVDEVVLVAGDESVLAPEWLPWQERLRPGDLGVGDLLPTPADDPRLVPGAFSAPVDEAEESLALELGLGRARVLSFEGRMEAVERWWDGPAGPEAPIARSAPATCATCGFLVTLAGALRQAFGVCANAFAPDDGRVVAVDHGCGGHSEAAVVPAALRPAPPLVDEVGYDVVGGPVGHEPGSVSDTDADEPVGHS